MARPWPRRKATWTEALTRGHEMLPVEDGTASGCHPDQKIKQRTGIEVRFGLDGEAVSVTDLFAGNEPWLPVAAQRGPGARPYGCRRRICPGRPVCWCRPGRPRRRGPGW